MDSSKRLNPAIPPTSNLKLTTLPSEILFLIIEYLTNEDRRKVRLVCQELYDVCNCPAFLESETLLFSGFYSNDRIFEALKNSKRELLRLRFEDTTFTKNDLPSWNPICSKIRSLYLNYSTFDDEVLEELIASCQNLSRLTLKFSDGNNSNHLKSLTDYLTKNHVNLNVGYLEIRIPTVDDMSADIVQALFRIFPKIKRFILKHNYCQNYDITEGAVVFTNILTEVGKLADQIDTLKTNLGFEISSIERLFTDLVSFKKLKHLRLNFAGVLTQAMCFKFPQLSYLQSLDLTLIVEHSPISFLIFLVQKMPNLRHITLRFNVECDLQFTSEAFVALLNSRLKSLFIPYGKLVLDDNFKTDENLTRNTTLRRLIIGCRYCTSGSHLLLPFVKYFVNLEHLEAADVTNDVVSGICEYQKNLKSLIIHDVDKCTDEGFIGFSDQKCHSRCESFSFRGFKKLEYLHMTADYCTLTKKTFAEFDFQKLKYLCLYLPFENDSSNETEFISGADRIFIALKQLPNLEAVRLYYSSDTTYDMWKELCITLKFLQFICIIGNLEYEKLTEEQYKSLFQIRPSLQVLVHEDYKNNIWEKYIRDAISDQIKKKSNDGVTFRRPRCKVGDVYFTWMCF